MFDRFLIVEGDVRKRILDLADESVDCVVTSPPYWGLRDYGVDGQLGIEASPFRYVRVLRDVFREVRRVLKPTGSLWLNLGDTYIAGLSGGDLGNITSQRNHNAVRAAFAASSGGTHRRARGLKTKDLVGIPWRVAFALQRDGWWLRCDTIWAKPNVMPENVTDRPTRSHEYFFLLSRSKKYFFDSAAIAEQAHGDKRMPGHTTRNARSVWSIAQTPEHEAHTATFPPELARRAILAGCPVDGVVLDPFAGLGTAGAVALEHGRRFIGVELNSKYVAIARERCVESLEARGEATIEHAEMKRAGKTTQLGLLVKRTDR